MGGKFYRIVRSASPSVEDFQSARLDGLPLVDARYHREWDEGVSVYDDRDYALARARSNRAGLGRFVATIEIPDDATIEFAKTMRNRRHYTVYADAEILLTLVTSVSAAVLDKD